MSAAQFDIDEDVWSKIDPLLPRQDLKPQGGRPPLPNYRIMGGILYRLRTGCQWKAMPERYGCGSAVHRHFQEWVKAGVFESVFEILLRHYDELRGIRWDWMSLDASFAKAPKGGDDTGRNPTDRGKIGTKRHVLTDARGVPVAVETSAANVNDAQRAEKTVDAIPEAASEGVRKPENLCMDKAYDSKKIDEAMKRRVLGVNYISPKTSITPPHGSPDLTRGRGRL